MTTTTTPPADHKKPLLGHRYHRDYTPDQEAARSLQFAITTILANNPATTTKQQHNITNWLYRTLYTILTGVDTPPIPLTPPGAELTITPQAHKYFHHLQHIANTYPLNTDIYGIAFQAVRPHKTRAGNGQHYTSLDTIRRVTQPAFLWDLEKQAATHNPTMLRTVLDQLAHTHIFDPACGSGNFLATTLHDMRRLEQRILNKLGKPHTPTCIPLSHFYGIEIDTQAIQAAQLALHTTNHTTTPQDTPTDLTQPTIIRADALRIDWENVCPPDPDRIIHIIGNPPFGGTSTTSPQQKQALRSTMGEVGISKPHALDYSTGWIIKTALYMSNTSNPRVDGSLITTRGVCCGTQAPILFPPLMKSGVKIGFAWTPFAWSSTLFTAASICVVIVGLRKNSDTRPIVLCTPTEHGHRDTVRRVDNINQYLVAAPNVSVEPRKDPLCPDFPQVRTTSYYLSKSLRWSAEEYDALVAEHPEVARFFMPYWITSNILYNRREYHLHVDSEDQLALLQGYPTIMRAIRRHHKYMKSHPQVNDPLYDTRSIVQCPMIIVPETSGEREWLPVTTVDGGVMAHKCFYITTKEVEGDPLWVVGVLCSRAMRVWLAKVGGRLKDSFRFSVTQVYNCFPLGQVNEENKEKLAVAARGVLEARDQVGGSLRDMYMKGRTDVRLRGAHRVLDGVVEEILGVDPGLSDDDVLIELFRLYREKVVD